MLRSLATIHGLGFEFLMRAAWKPGIVMRLFGRRTASGPEFEEAAIVSVSFARTSISLRPAGLTAGGILDIPANRSISVLEFFRSPDRGL